MNQRVVQTLLPAKVEKLDFILNWASENCSEEQFDRINEKLNEYHNVLLYYPMHGSTNIAHETSYIQTQIPDKRDLLGNEQERQQIRDEIRKHKELVNNLQARIYELEKLLEEDLQ